MVVHFSNDVETEAAFFLLKSSKPSLTRGWVCHQPEASSLSGDLVGTNNYMLDSPPRTTFSETKIAPESGWLEYDPFFGWRVILVSGSQYRAADVVSQSFQRTFFME